MQCDPFSNLDEAVCNLLKTAVQHAREVNPAIRCSIILGESGIDARYIISDWLCRSSFIYFYIARPVSVLHVACT